MEFRKYDHLERYGHDEVEGLEFGICHVFPKLDGSNGSVWFDGTDWQFGSRRRHLTGDLDNSGFKFNLRPQMPSIMPSDWIIYGEWLVPGACIQRTKEFAGDLF